MTALGAAASGRRLLQDVPFRVEPGQRGALLGASGSGKTLTALAVLGLLGPQFQVGGSLRLDGREVPWRQAPGRRPGMAGGFQDSLSALNPVVRLDRQLLPAVARRRSLAAAQARNLVHTLLAEVGLEDPDRVLGSRSVELSGGQRQRVCLALAMAATPGLLVADEPTTALGMISQSHVLAALRRCTGEGRSALLFITHDLAAAGLCDYAVVLDQGRVAEGGPMGRILAAPQAPVTASLVEAARTGQRPVPVPLDAAS
ncbi:ABC transporter ATP-binding protein [Arthrobacter deserti]|uniref:ABC transporter ATP-binding protein n=1 Tax=Arthrobacter deserti TaxID=1742687 RepID=A0ABX1JLH0_9MICC|nr:ABC transporter ATP-binding protein [Arthrobacter deserti]